jgi:hypothetical protein
MDMLTKIAQEIQKADQGKRVAMIHYQALKNAEQLAGHDLSLFCKEAGISETYITEIAKMISLKRFMNEIGAKIVF